MQDSLKRATLTATDLLMAAIPRRVPSRAALEGCKIISHRGEHDNVRVLENTLPAFDIARKNGVWGVECDIRWTSDLVPVVCHDPSAARVFGMNVEVGQVPFRELRQVLPAIPTLEEIVTTFGGTTHLMLELKAENFPQPTKQRQVLGDILSRLAPGSDFHLLSLDPALFDLFNVVPPEYCCPVAEINVTRLSEHSLEAGHAGLGGHFLLLNDKVRQRHHRAGQQLGTGFISSRNCLFRELNRGVGWIFSNHAVKIQKIRDHYLAISAAEQSG